MKQQIKVIAFALCGICFAANAANIPVELVNAGFEQVDKDGYPKGWRKHKDWHGGYVYLMAVNCTRKPQSATVSVEAETSKGAEADFGAMPEIKGGKIDFSFGPLGYVMLKLRQ